MIENKSGLFSRKQIIKKNLICMAVAITLFILNEMILKEITSGKIKLFFGGHFNDLICPLFFLGYCQIVFVWIKKELKSYSLIMLLIMVAGLIWEYLIPLLKPASTSDPLDLMFYFIGANIYYLTMVLKYKQ